MANLKQRLRRKNADGSYDTVYLQADLSNVTGTLGISNGGTGATSASGALSNLGAAAASHGHAASEIWYNENTVQTYIDVFWSDIYNLKSSVSSGKTLVAAAVTDKGVPTAADATFATMASNISSIQTQPPIAYIYPHTTNGYLIQNRHTLYMSTVQNQLMITYPAGTQTAVDNTTYYWFWYVKLTGYTNIVTTGSTGKYGYAKVFKLLLNSTTAIVEELMYTGAVSYTRTYPFTFGVDDDALYLIASSGQDVWFT